MAFLFVGDATFSSYSKFDNNLVLDTIALLATLLSVIVYITVYILKNLNIQIYYLPTTVGIPNYVLMFSLKMLYIG